MTNLILASFKEDAKAIEAAQKLSELEAIGDITLYEWVILKKHPDGNTEVLRAETTEGERSLAGLTAGALVGALAGPVGVAAGMLAGSLSGAAMEADYLGFSEGIGAKVSSTMQPGSVAVIAEIEEEDPVFVDSTLALVGGTLVRADVDYVYDRYLEKEIEALDEEIAAERARVKSAVAAEREKVQTRLAQLKEKRRRKIEEFVKKAKETAATVKSRARAREDDMDASVREFKITRIKTRIARYQEKLDELKGELRQMEG
jgi:uncharacterized membrane protein